MTDNPDNLLARAIATVLRELGGLPQDQEVSISDIAPYFRAAALRAITNIDDLAGVLLRSVDPGPSLDAPELADICQAAVRAASNLQSTFSLWLWVLGKDQSAGRLHMLPKVAEAARDCADTLAQVARCADSSMPMPADDQAAMASYVKAMLVLVKPLHQELNAAPGDPASATPGENRHA